MKIKPKHYMKGSRKIKEEKKRIRDECLIVNIDKLKHIV